MTGGSSHQVSPRARAHRIAALIGLALMATLLITTNVIVTNLVTAIYMLCARLAVLAVPAQPPGCPSPEAAGR